MTNNKKRRILKESQKATREVEVEEMRQTQERARKQPPRHQVRGATGCQKRRRRKHRPQGVKLMQSKRGYLRPYYPHEFEAIKRGER